MIDIVVMIAMNVNIVSGEMSQRNPAVSPAAMFTRPVAK